MQKEIFAGRLRGLLPAPDKEMTARWLNWADECAQFYQEHRHNTDALLRQTPEAVLEELHAGFFLARQRYGREAAQKCYELVQSHALYANELLGAAAFFYGGGMQEDAAGHSINEMFESGALMGPILPQIELEKKKLTEQITQGFQALWAKYPPTLWNSSSDDFAACAFYEVIVNRTSHFFLSAAGLWPETVLTMAANAVRTQGLSFAEVMDCLDRQGNYIPGLPAQLRLMERLTDETAKWLADGFGYTAQIGRRVVLDMEPQTITTEFSPETFPAINQLRLLEDKLYIPKAVYRLASPTLYAVPPEQDAPFLHALYTVVEDGVTSYLGGDAGCMLTFKALRTAGAYAYRFESAAATLEHLTPTSLPFSEPNVNAGPVFYPVTPDRAEQLLGAFGMISETAMLVQLELDSGMVRVEYNSFCYPEGLPCDFSIPIDEGLCCLQEVIDEATDAQAQDPRVLEALLLGKIEDSLGQIAQRGMTPEVNPCS